MKLAIAQSQLEGLRTDTPVRNIHDYLERHRFWSEVVQWLTP